jgi:signal transduction histidine kinase
LTGLVQETIDAIKPHALSKHATLECQLPPESIAIMGHPIQLKRAIQNLIGNAIDALQGPSGHVFITCATTDNSIELIVSDNGEGIDQQHLPHIFKPFYSSKSPGSGTGLGLFITQKIIEDHHGSISIDSTRGHGTRAVIRFPALEAAKQAS